MIKNIWNKPYLTNKEENRLKQGITKWKQGLCWETNTKGNMRQVQAVTPGGIPRLTICEVLVELEKYYQRAKLTIRILERVASCRSSLRCFGLHPSGESTITPAGRACVAISRKEQLACLQTHKGQTNTSHWDKRIKAASISRWPHEGAADN